VLYHNIFANNIAYVDYLFDLSKLPSDLIPYVNLLAHLLGDLDTDGYSYSDLSNKIYMNTGGIDFETSVYIRNNDDSDFAPKFSVSGKAIGDNNILMLDLMNEIITNTKFDDRKRLKELMQQIKSKTEMRIYRIGNTVASRRVASYFSPATKYIEKMRGLDYYWFITDLLKDFDDKVDTVIDKLKEVSATVFNTNDMIISFIGDHDDFNRFKTHYQKVVHNISTTVLSSESVAFVENKCNEGIQSSSNVQYVAKGYNFKRLGYNYHGSMRVLETMLNSEFLHDRVRAKGGAYGCNLSFGKSGNLTVASYRDPNLGDTLNVYNEIATYLDSLNIDEEGLSKFIIGAMGRLDYAKTPVMKGQTGLRNYISHTSMADIQQERDEILNTRLEDIKGLSSLIKDVMAQDCHCVLGNDKAIQDSKDIFNSLISLNR